MEHECGQICGDDGQRCVKQLLEDGEFDEWEMAEHTKGERVRLWTTAGYEGVTSRGREMLCLPMLVSSLWWWKPARHKFQEGEVG